MGFKKGKPGHWANLGGCGCSGEMWLLEIWVWLPAQPPLAVWSRHVTPSLFSFLSKEDTNIHTWTAPTRKAYAGTVCTLTTGRTILTQLLRCDCHSMPGTRQTPRKLDLGLKEFRAKEIGYVLNSGCSPSPALEEEAVHRRASGEGKGARGG